jgi:hypothetical protein
MSTNLQIKAVSQRCAFLLRLLEEAQTSGDRQRALVLYSMAQIECDNMARTLDTLLFRKRPADKLLRTRAA